MMNAIRLAKSGVLRASDLDEQQRTRLVYSSQPDKIADAVQAGLLVLDDLPPELRQIVAALGAKRRGAKTGERGERPKYRIADLAVPELRTRMDGELRLTRWQVVITAVRPEGDFGFAKHPQFDSEIYFRLTSISSPEGRPCSPGQTLDARLATRFDARRDRWGFAVDSGRVIEASS